MLAYQVLVNGKVVCTAGHEHVSDLSATLIWPSRRGHWLRVGGTVTIPAPPSGGKPGQHGSSEHSYHVDWFDGWGLRVGDEVTIRIVDVPGCDPGRAGVPVEPVFRPR